MSFTVDDDTLCLPWSDAPVRVLTLHVHALGWRDGARIAEAFGLPELDRYRRVSEVTGAWDYRRWTGWVAEASDVTPVSVDVVAAQRVEPLDQDELFPYTPSDLDPSADAAADRWAV
ncbi:MAG: hypothetical protein J2P23_08660 [Microlunatus sp.]|nr:hypothetical protein [Microlunatus sp.]